MQMSRYSKIAVVFFILVLFSIGIVAAQERKVTLEGSPYAVEARGEAVIKDIEGTVRGEPAKEITINAHGLHPNSVYTVWFLNMKPRTEISKVSPDNSFRTDNRGIGSFTASVPASELSKWNSLEVAFQPSGDPSDMRNRQFALRGYLQ